MTNHSETRTITTVAEARSALRDVRDRGVRWLLDHVDDDGKPADAENRNGYYRLPWTLAHVGEREVAAAVMSWIERSALTDSGDLREGPARKNFIVKSSTYPLSIIAQGAWLLERYDTALAVMRTVRGLQNEQTGGAFWERPEARSTGRQLIYPTAQLGLAALTTGQRDMADAVFGWFERLWNAQPDLPKRLFTAWGPEGLVTSPSPEHEFICVVDFDKPRQTFYNPGISASFLSRYYMVSGNATARAIARDMLRLSADGTRDQFNYWESMQICKFGWGSAMAHEIDPAGDHEVHVVRMAQWYHDSQAADGTWVPSGFMVPEPQIGDAMTKTAEHILWVSMMLSSLAGGQPRGEVAGYKR